MEKLALTIPEAVAASGICRTKFYELFKVGAITPRKVGKRTLILRRDLEDYLNSLPPAISSA